LILPENTTLSGPFHYQRYFYFSTLLKDLWAAFLLSFSCFWWQIVSTYWVLQKHQNYKICQVKYSTYSSQSKFIEIWNANLLHIIFPMRMKSSITATKMTGYRHVCHISMGNSEDTISQMRFKWSIKWPSSNGDMKMTVFLLLS